jgi:DNA polymerase III subunit epsilon
VVFTGKLSMPRREAADLAAEAGCDVATSVSQKVTLLVVGVQDLRGTKGRKKSSKHRKAEQLIQEGCDIAIVGEEDFLELVGDPSGPDSA